MKKLLILPLLVLLTGCVTYYYPQTALEDGVYYAEDDPSYTVYSGGYAGVAYYPWSSLDYFYMGYNPYPRYGFGYSYGGGFSIGFSYGYSPWYYPYSYYGYYSPRYASHYHYPYYPAWRSYSGYCSHYGNCHHKYKKRYRDDRHDRYAGNDRDGRRGRGDDHEDGNRHSTVRDNERSHTGSYRTSPVRRYVSTPPSGHSGNRGMVIRNRETTKTGKNRLEPDKSASSRAAPVRAVSVTPSNSRKTKASYRTRRTGNEVRYSSRAKQTRSRTGPVESSRSSKGIAISARPSPVTVVPGNRGGDRRSAQGQAVQVKTTRQESGRPPSRSNSHQRAAPKQSSNSGNSKRSARGPSKSASSSSGHRSSEKRQSSRREHRK